MAQIIDFASRKKQLEGKTNNTNEKIEPIITNFSMIAERNKQIKEKVRKKREEENKNVMKSYRIK